MCADLHRVLRGTSPVDLCIRCIGGSDFTANGIKRIGEVGISSCRLSPHSPTGDVAGRLRRTASGGTVPGRFTKSTPMAVAACTASGLGSGQVLSYALSFCTAHLSAAGPAADRRLEFSTDSWRNAQGHMDRNVSCEHAGAGTPWPDIDPDAHATCAGCGSEPRHVEPCTATEPVIETSHRRMHLLSSRIQAQTRRSRRIAPVFRRGSKSFRITGSSL